VRLPQVILTPNGDHDCQCILDLVKRGETAQFDICKTSQCELVEDDTPSTKIKCDKIGKETGLIFGGDNANYDCQCLLNIIASPFRQAHNVDVCAEQSILGTMQLGTTETEKGLEVILAGSSSCSAQSYCTIERSYCISYGETWWPFIQSFCETDLKMPSTCATNCCTGVGDISYCC
jgi:hypothetical protein